MAASRAASNEPGWWPRQASLQYLMMSQSCVHRFCHRMGRRHVLQSLSLCGVVRSGLRLRSGMAWVLDAVVFVVMAVCKTNADRAFARWPTHAVRLPEWGTRRSGLGLRASMREKRYDARTAIGLECELTLLLRQRDTIRRHS